MATSVLKLSEKYPEYVWFKLDLTNAYNTQPRMRALATLRRAAPGLVNFLGLFYGRSSRYLYVREESQSG